MDRFVKRWVKREIPASYLFIHNRPEFVGPGIGRELAALVAYFLRYAHAHRPVPSFWGTHPRPDVGADEIPAIAVLQRREKVKACLKPVREAVRDLQGFVPLVVRWVHAIRNSFR